MTATATETDISVLVGQMPTEPCDTPGHMMNFEHMHDDGPATHYLMWHKPCGCFEPTVVARCERFKDAMLKNEPMYCGVCTHRGLSMDFYTVIGPIEAI